MSGYFDALMRSSGMDIGGRAPATAYVERSPAATASRAVETAPASQQAVAPIPAADSIEQPVLEVAPARSAPSMPDADAHGAQAAFAGPDEVRPHTMTDADSVADAPAVPATRPAEGTKPDLGQQLVRAAMQWVAADPQHVPAVAKVVPPRGQPPLSRDEGTSVIAPSPVLSRPPRDRGVDASAEPLRATVATPPALDLTTHEPFAPPALPIRSARQAAAVPPVPVASSSRDEVVEVSIGAIHVRVDAPSAQTVARPATMSPATGPRAGTATPVRSALSRRALRRI